MPEPRSCWGSWSATIASWPFVFVEVLFVPLPDLSFLQSRRGHSLFQCHALVSYKCDRASCPWSAGYELVLSHAIATEVAWDLWSLWRLSGPACVSESRCRSRKRQGHPHSRNRASDCTQPQPQRHHLWTAWMLIPASLPHHLFLQAEKTLSQLLALELLYLWAVPCSEPMPGQCHCTLSFHLKPWEQGLHVSRQSLFSQPLTLFGSVIC